MRFINAYPRLKNDRCRYRRKRAKFANVFLTFRPNFRALQSGTQRGGRSGAHRADLRRGSGSRAQLLIVLQPEAAIRDFQVINILTGKCSIKNGYSNKLVIEFSFTLVVQV